ncbi:hypothetical protein X975_21709, partial [Stegodyphus mimosarum]
MHLKCRHLFQILGSTKTLSFPLNITHRSLGDFSQVSVHISSGCLHQKQSNTRQTIITFSDKLSALYFTPFNSVPCLMQRKFFRRLLDITATKFSDQILEQ